MHAADPEVYDPPLSRWGTLWRLAVTLLLSALAWGETAYHQWHGHQLWFWIDLAGGAASFVLVRYRRRWPYPVALVLTAFGFFSVSAAGPGVLAVVSLCTRRNFRHILPVAVLNVVATQLYTVYAPTGDSNPGWVDFAFSVAATVAVVALGMYVGSRRELLWSLRERAAQAEAEQELRIERARSGERERIAREMHDVLAHRISLVTMHAGALAYRTDLPPEQVHETARLIHTKANEALTDLRQVLGVLRADDAAEDRPQPTIGDLDQLLAESRSGGMVVELANGLGSGQPPDQVGRTLYRIVQEALTNARKHAAGAHVSVRLDGDAESGISVVVRNAKRVGVRTGPAAPSSGLGLVGLRERAALAGGSLAVEETREAFTLRGWLPWTT